MKNWPLDNLHCVVMDWLWSLEVVTVNVGEAVDMPCQVIMSTRSYNIISVTVDAVAFENKQAFSILYSGFLHYMHSSNASI